MLRFISLRSSRQEATTHRPFYAVQSWWRSTMLRLSIAFIGLLGLSFPGVAQDQSQPSEIDPQTETELNAETFAKTDIIGRFWELGEHQKRGVFDLRTYHPNF